MCECKRAVRTKKDLQPVRTQVSDVDCRLVACTDVASGNGGWHVVCTNIGQRYVPTRFCNAYECRSILLMAD